MLKRAVASAVRSAAAPMRTSSTGTTTSTAAFTGVKRLTPAFTSNSSGIMGMGGSTPSSQWSWMAPAVQRSYFIRHTVAPLQDASKDAEAAAEEASATADAAAGADAGADAAEAGASGDGSSSSGGDRSPLEEAEERIQTLEAQNKELADTRLRMLAEMENVRAIARKDVANAKKFATKSFAKQMLSVVDNLERALQSVPEEARTEENRVLVQLYDGVVMTQAELLKVFKQNGIEQYGQIGDKFDPAVHAALFEMMHDELEPGTVGQVVSTGFMLHDTVLRAAEVGTVRAA